jgi:hypothetical protein
MQSTPVMQYIASIAPLMLCVWTVPVIVIAVQTTIESLSKQVPMQYKHNWSQTRFNNKVYQ